MQDMDIVRVIPFNESFITGDDVEEDVMRHQGELNMSLRFDHFSEDGVTAFFKARSWMSYEMVVISPPHLRLQKAFFNALHYYDQKYASFAEGPHHMIYLRGVVNEIGLPGFSVNRKKGEVGLDWKRLFQKLFTEEARCTVNVSVLVPCTTS